MYEARRRLETATAGEDRDEINAAAEACYTKARPLDNTDFVMNWRKQMTREYTLRALQELM